MRINVTSVFVDDQDNALRFYTEVLGFVKKTEIPLGEHRWLTVVSPQDPDGVELLLEPDGHPAVGPFREALNTDGIPSVLSASLKGPTAGWPSGSRSSSTPSGSWGETTVSHRCSPSGISVFFTNPSTSV